MITDESLIHDAVKICSNCLPTGSRAMEAILRLGSLNEKGHRLLDRMLDVGDDPNIMLPCGERPLHLAILLNDAIAVEMLLRHGAKLSSGNRHAVLPIVLLSTLATSADEWPPAEQEIFERIVMLVQSNPI